MDLDEDIRFKVSKEIFVEVMPVVREQAGQDGSTVGLTSSRQSPYSIVVRAPLSFRLGPTSRSCFSLFCIPTGADQP